ncbi:MAG TPA: aquaporin [Verrucomicrobiae bacterium]
MIPYIVSQCSGAFAASGVLQFLFPTNPTLGSTLPAGTEMQSFVLELILTFLLMFVIRLKKSRRGRAGTRLHP